MKFFQIFTLLFLIELIPSCTSNSSSSSQDLEVLFTKENKDWITGGTATWTFIGEELVGKSDSGSSFIMTNQVYKDFELTLEFMPDSTVNSGVFVRCQNQELSADDCYEINIWDLHPNQDYRTGTIVRRSERAEKVETLNKWNTYVIKLQGNHLQASINGIETADVFNDDLVEGYIGLQTGQSGEIRFRNVALRKISSE